MPGPPPPPTDRHVTDEDRRRAWDGSRGVIETHLNRLAALPAHGNRRLHVDQLVRGLLLSFYDPLCRSLRRLESCGDFGGRLDIDRLARSTTADALATFDPSLLRPLVDDLVARVPHLAQADPDLATVARRIVAADGTYLTTLADVACWAFKHTKTDGRKQGQVRANVQLDVATWCPLVVTVSGDDGESEATAVGRDLLSGVLYVVDRNFLDFAFLRDLLAAGSDVVLRVKANAPSARVTASRPLTPEDAAAGVVADEVVTLPGRGAPPDAFRLVTVHATDRRGGPEVIRLLTNLAADAAPAHVVAAVYRLRWQVELFFKWLKCWARMDHLLSASRNGVTTQLYVAVIAVLTMYAQSGRRVSVYALQVLSYVARGEMTIDRALTILARRERERELERARQARRRAAAAAAQKTA
jgi:hypothetical protein